MSSRKGLIIFLYGSFVYSNDLEDKPAASITNTIQRVNNKAQFI